MDIRAQIEARIQAVKAAREDAGLKVEWMVPDPRGGTRYFSAYASSETVKAQWIANGKVKGWELLNG